VKTATLLLRTLASQCSSAWLARGVPPPLSSMVTGRGGVQPEGWFKTFHSVSVCAGWRFYCLETAQHLLRNLPDPHET
jgi:hypothetical protein